MQLKHSLAGLKEKAAQTRRDIIRMTHGAQSGHPGGSLGCTEFFTAMYYEILEHKPQPFDMDGKEQDLFFLSNGHISPVWYSTLARSGYFPVKELATFRKINSRLQGHPATAEHLPGIRVASGSLGQGLSVAIGAALAKKLNGDKKLVYSLHGDGEIQEGQIWEAAMFAAHHKVDNLISTIDNNGQQIDGPNNEVIGLGDIKAKWLAFGWEVIANLPDGRQVDGNNLEEVLHIMEKAKAMTGKGKPIMIIMKTVMGKGVDYMENNFKWHGVAPNDEQFAKAMAQLQETSLGDY